MLREIDNYYLQKEEPDKSCLLALREYILAYDKNITEAWKYKMPFFCYNGKMFCYLWVHKRLKQPYLGVVEGNKIDHPQLIIENRSRMKIMLIDPDKDLPIKIINTILSKALSLYKVPLR
ncbi:DUF1801 domain-containing protein [Chitinophagaceae bacterium LWZ2-11]